MKKCMNRCLLAVALLVMVATASLATDVTPLTATKAQELIQNTPELVIIDVRTPNEYQSGHIKNARNIDFYGRDFQQRLDTLDKTIPYLVYCRSGRRSNVTIKYLKQVGFETIYHITDGIIDWQNSGLPLVHP